MAGMPTSPNAFPKTPDGFGVGTTAIDFDQGIAGGVKNVIYFYPDGSAQDAAGNINNGVVYLCCSAPGNPGYTHRLARHHFVGRHRASASLAARVGRSPDSSYYWRQQ